MTVEQLLLLSAVILCSIGVISILALRADKNGRRVARRRTAVIASYAPGEDATTAFARLAVLRQSASVKNRLWTLAGMDTQRRDPYPIKLIHVIPPALVVGWVARWLLHGLIGPFSWALMPLTAWYVVRSVYKGLDARRSAKLYRQFPDALATIVRAVRVGIPVTEAIKAVSQDADAPTCIEFGRLYDQIGIGAALEDALREMAARNRLPEYRFFATALALQSQTGGGLTETLDNLAEVVRRRVVLKARGYALAAEARTSAGVLASLPVFAGAALAVMNPTYIAPLMEEGPGQTVFGVGVVWLGLGMLLMRTLIRKSLG